MKLRIAAGIVIILIACIVLLAWWQLRRCTDGCVAYVHGVGISRQAHDEAVRSLTVYHAYSQPQSTPPASLANDALRQLIDRQLILEYASKHRIHVSDTDAQAELVRLASAAKQSESEYLQKIDNMYGKNRQQHLDDIRLELLKPIVQAQLGQPLAKWLEDQRQQDAVRIESAGGSR
jgi:FKBP-type peptidyl-prolyl cis-trans isomerase (trigger factor)